MLQPVFNQLLLHYTDDAHHVERLRHELLKKYGGPRRYYHNLAHLEHMYCELLAVQSYIEGWNTVLFALFYHDVVYNPLRRDNEKRSAALAAKRLQEMLPTVERMKCFFLILATAGHEKIKELDYSDLDFFLDADLAIFGQTWAIYEAYAKNIRKEYGMYPDFMYNKGRKKALTHFLQMDRIFKTEPFFMRYEKPARQNILMELEQL